MTAATIAVLTIWILAFDGHEVKKTHEEWNFGSRKECEAEARRIEPLLKRDRRTLLYSFDCRVQ